MPFHHSEGNWRSPTGLHAGSGLVDDAVVRRATTDRASGQRLRMAAIGGLAFTMLYLVHRLLQGTGPDSSSMEAVAAYQVAHRGALVASEVAVGWLWPWAWCPTRPRRP